MSRLRLVVVNDKMQRNYRYRLVKPAGEVVNENFRPQLTPKQMLALGVFGGKYMTDSQAEFPQDWFVRAKLSPVKKDPSINYFGVDASLPLSVWRQKGWIYQEDPRGWFQWYCRYYMGRRLPEYDNWQQTRWRQMKRHWVQIKRNCRLGDYGCRPRQRQALLHWAYDSRKI